MFQIVGGLIAVLALAAALAFARAFILTLLVEVTGVEGGDTVPDVGMF